VRPDSANAIRARSLLRSAGLDTERDLLQRYGTIAAILWILAPILLLPALLRLEPSAQVGLYVLSATSVLLGSALLFAPWERVGWGGLHLSNAAAIGAIAIAYALSDQSFAAVFFMPAVFSAYVFRTRIEVVAHVALIAVAIVLALLVGPHPDRNSVTIALAGYPILVLIAGTIAYQRERLVASQASYQRLALEAIRLTLRIRERRPSASRSAGGDAEQLELTRLEEIASALEQARRPR
jgi:hypothetical protein